MALQITGIPRVFKFENGSETIELIDPNPDFLPDEVMTFFANQYPVLTTSTIKGMEIIEDKAVYEFVTTIGVKG